MARLPRFARQPDFASLEPMAPETGPAATGGFASSNPVAGAPAPEIAAFLAQKTRQHHVVHFGSAIDQTRGARGAVDPFQDRVFRITAGAIELDRGVGSLVQRIGDMHL